MSGSIARHICGGSGDGPVVLRPEARLDSCVMRALTALNKLPGPEIAVATSECVRSAESPWAAALAATLLHSLPPENTATLVERQVKFLVSRRNSHGSWSFVREWTQDKVWDLDTSVCAEAALTLAGPHAMSASANGFLIDYDSGASHDLACIANMLYWHRVVGREEGQLAERAFEIVNRFGIVCGGTSRRFSPPMLAFLLGRWLTANPSADGAHGRLRKAIVEQLDDLILSSKLITPLDYSCAVATLFDLGGVSAETHDLAHHILQLQHVTGLWPAAGICAGPHGEVYGSSWITTVFCVLAIYRYLGGSPGLFLSRRESRSTGKQCRAGTFDQLLDEVAPSIPDTLVSAECYDDVRAVTRFFPADIADGFGLECRLGEKHRRADLFLLLRPEGGQMLASCDYSPTGELLSSHPVWKRLKQWCQAWAEADSILNREVRFLWLEFDVDGPLNHIPLPSVFLDFSSANDNVRDLEREQQIHRLSAQTLEDLLGRVPSPKLLNNLKRCREALPGQARIFALGAMLGREWNGARIAVKDAAPDSLLKYLDAIGWRGHRKALLRLVEDLSPRTDRLFWDIDVGDDILPGIGLECKFYRSPRDEPRWQALLAFLERNGLCRAEKIAGVLSWPGPYYCVAPGGDRIWRSCYSNFVSHVKVALGADGSLQAKVYFGSWRWLSKSALQQPKS